MKSVTTIVLGLTAICWAAVCQAASGPVQPVFTKQTRFRIPFRYDAAEMQRLGAREIRLYTSYDRGVRWQHVQSVRPDTGRFDFRARGDGEYWFAVRTLDAHNQLHPPGNIIEAGLKVVVDTKPPVLEINLIQTAPGQVQLAWDSSDENLDPTKLRLEYIQAGAANWQQVSIVPQPSGQTSWSVPQGGFVAVRGSVSDRAANVGRAQQQIQIGPARPDGPRPTGVDLRKPIAATPQPSSTLPEQEVAVFPGASDKTAFRPFPSTAQWPHETAGDTAIAGPDATAAEQGPMDLAVSDTSNSRPGVSQRRFVNPAATQPPTRPASRHRVVNTKRFQIGYKVDDVGPSGISSVELFVTEDDGRKWWKYGDDLDRQSPFQVDVPGDGMYGFTLLVRNGTGLSGEPPQPGEKPSFVVVVDETPPVAELMPIQQGPAVAPNQVLIRWNVRDDNPADNPIALYYSADPRGPWQPIGDWRVNGAAISGRSERKCQENSTSD